MRLLVTGGSGFVGRHVVELAHRRRYEVAVIDPGRVDPRRASGLAHLIQSPISREALERLVDAWTPDVCLHLAGRSSVPASLQDPLGDFDCGVIPTLAVLEVLRQRAPKCRFVLASSAAVYGNPDVLPVPESHALQPVSPYGFHKFIAEQLCREYATVYGHPTASVRIFSAYGEGLPRQVVFDVFQKAFAAGPITLQGSRLASRDFVHVSDVAAGLLHVAEQSPMEADVYNLSSGVETSIEQLANSICQVVGRAKVISFDGTVPKGSPIRWKADISKLTALGFTPSVCLEDGLRSLNQWLTSLDGAQS